MIKKDLCKNLLYESVKQLIDNDAAAHIHLNQHKLFTLFSIAFQYMLFMSTKKPGAYIIRIEDSILAEKLARKSKDESTRRFIQSLLIPRKIKYEKSLFYLDFFHLGTWKLTNDIPKEKLRGAIIVKNTSERPMKDLMVDESENAETASDSLGLSGLDLPQDYYVTSLQSIVPKTITIAYDKKFENTSIVQFPFIKKNEELPSGVKLGKNIDLSHFDD